jgi:hypothetical protein
MFREVADVKSQEELKLSSPALEGGKARTVVVDKSDGLAAYVETLVERAEKVRSRSVTSDQDNMLRSPAKDARRRSISA